MQATLLALTTHNQRRLIKQQVRSGLLVAPVQDKDKGTPGSNSKGKLWDSDDEETSSEEDFDFVQQQLDDGKVNPETMKLLRGIV